MILNFGDDAATVQANWSTFSSAYKEKTPSTFVQGNGVAVNALYPGDRLEAGEFVRSANGVYILVMQHDGNLVWYESPPSIDSSGVLHGNARWSSGSQGRGGDRLLLQQDGNLVIYKGEPANAGSAHPSGPAAWALGFPEGLVTPKYLGLQDDGNLVWYMTATDSVYRDGKPIWACCAGHGHTPGFWDTVASIAEAIPAIAVAPIVAPTLAIASVVAAPITGSPTQLFTDVATYSATHPIETIAITAGAAAGAYGVGAIALGTGIAGAAAAAKVAGTVGTTAAAGLGVAKAAGVLPSGAPSTATAKTPSTTPVSPATSAAMQAGMADLKLPIIALAGLGLLAVMLYGSKKKGARA